MQQTGKVIFQKIMIELNSCQGKGREIFQRKGKKSFYFCLSLPRRQTPEVKSMSSRI